MSSRRQQNEEFVNVDVGELERKRRGQKKNQSANPQEETPAKSESDKEEQTPKKGYKIQKWNSKYGPPLETRKKIDKLFSEHGYSDVNIDLGPGQAAAIRHIILENAKKNLNLINSIFRILSVVHIAPVVHPNKKGDDDDVSFIYDPKITPNKNDWHVENDETPKPAGRQETPQEKHFDPQIQDSDDKKFQSAISESENEPEKTPGKGYFERTKDALQNAAGTVKRLFKGDQSPEPAAPAILHDPTTAGKTDEAEKQATNDVKETLTDTRKLLVETEIHEKVLQNDGVASKTQQHLGRCPNIRTKMYTVNTQQIIQQIKIKTARPKVITTIPKAKMQNFYDIDPFH